MKYPTQLFLVLLVVTTATAALRGGTRNNNNQGRKLTSYASCDTVACCSQRAARSCGGETPFFDRNCFINLQNTASYKDCISENTHFSTEAAVTITNYATNRRFYAPAPYSAGSSSGDLPIVQNAEWSFVPTSGCPEAGSRECFQVKNRATSETLGSNEFLQLFTYPDDLLSLALNRLRFRFLETACPSDASGALWCGHIIGFDRRALTDSPNRAGQIETRPLASGNDSQLWIIRGR